MNEGVDSTRDAKCASRRRVIRKALSLPPDSALRPHSSLTAEIAFAKSVILPGFIHKKDARRNKERCKVMKERLKTLKDPSFEDRIHIAASTVNPDRKTRDMNAKGYHKRSVSVQKIIRRNSLIF